MGKWLAAFHAELGSNSLPFPRANSAISANSSDNENKRGPNGTIGAIGTEVERAEAPRPADLLALKALSARGVEGQSTRIRDEQDALDDFEELAGRLEFQSGMNRADAERQARAEVYGPGAAVWVLDPTRRAARPLSDAEVDAMLRDRRLNS